jgi:RNA polymerase sigma-70 factor, ECF subfamily
MPWINAHAVDAQPGVRDWMSHANAITAAELHERYLKEIFRYVLQRATSLEEAEDITAEVFAAATTGLPRFRGECSPHLWLLSIARRQIARAHRGKAARRETLASELAGQGPEDPALWEALAAVEGPEAVLLRAEARRELYRLIRQLNPDQREALMLHYMERLSVAEIAVVMERTPGAIASLLHRARAALYRQGRGYFLGEDEGQER